MEEVGEVSSCTVGCDCVMMCMHVRASKRLAKCLLTNVCLSVCAPSCAYMCVLDVLYSTYVFVYTVQT